MDYKLSADGSAVVRLTAKTTLAASTLNTALITAGYTVTTGSAGTLTTNIYNADFKGGNGGANYTALYAYGAALPAGTSLNWVQVITTNDALGSAVSPYLDNGISAATLAKPFYSYTQENKDGTLPANQLNFYDFSTRSPNDLTKVNPINWDAKLYPVLVKGTTLTVESGIEWGWTMKKAMVGTATGTFVNPTPGGAVTTGVGTSSFTWGSGDPSGLSFAGAAIDAKPNVSFKLGTVTFHNGSINGSSGADSVELDIPISFTNVPEKNFIFKTTLILTNTTNTDDPIASADQVTLGSFGYTFNVQEGATASADIFATLSTGLAVTPDGAAGDALKTTFVSDPDPSYTLAIDTISAPTTGGFVTAAFSVDNQTTHVKGLSGGTQYSGPVSGLKYQYLNTGSDNLNVTGGLANEFIHTGSGFDAIDVSPVGGTNVLDGGTNSNFLVGGKAGTGTDTFFVDDRSPSADIWSTVVNFHAGDAATIFGITQSGFATDWVDNQGAAGYTGLTLHVTAPGVPTASITLSGYTTADLGNGSLSTSFGTETDGTPYLYIHGNA